MTIQQHASFDSSAAELNATSKLVKAWESKNAKNAAKAGGISLMALSLAACGGSSTTTTTPVVETPVVDTPAVDAVVSIALTTSTDTGSAFTGGSGDDVFTGIVDYGTGLTISAASTYEQNDVIDGGAGSDTVTILMQNGSTSGTAGGSAQTFKITTADHTADATPAISAVIGGVTYTGESLGAGNVTAVGDDAIATKIKTLLDSVFLGDATVTISGDDSNVVTVSGITAGQTLDITSISLGSTAYAATPGTATIAAGADGTLADIPGATLTNVEIVEINNTSGAPVTGSASNWASAEQIWNVSAAASNNVTINDVVVGTTLGVKGKSNLDVNFKDSTGAAPIVAGEVNVALSGAGTSSADSDLTITAGASQTFTTLNVDAVAGKNYVNINGSATSSATKLVATGEGSLSVNLQSGMNTVDASGLSGGLTAAIGGEVDTVLTGGAGNDVITASSGTVLAASKLAVNAGEGVDTLVIGSGDVGTSAIGARYTGFETISVVADQDVSLVAGINSVKVTADTAALTNLTSAQANAITVSDAGGNNVHTGLYVGLNNATGTADSVTITLADADLTQNVGITELDVRGIEVVNIVASTGTNTSGESAVDFEANDADDVKSITFTGSADTKLTVDSDVLDVVAVDIDASGLTGTGDFTLVAGSLVAGSSVTGSANDDVLDISTIEGVAYSGGAGKDTFQGLHADLMNNGTDRSTFDGGDGSDTLKLEDTGAITMSDNHFLGTSNMEKMHVVATSAGDVSITTGLAFNTAFSTGVTFTTGDLANDDSFKLDAVASTVDMNVTLTATALLGDNAAGDDVTVITGSGDDVIDAQLTAFVSAADGGSVVISSGAGDDTITLNLGATIANNSNTQVVTITGGAGKDTITKEAVANGTDALASTVFVIGSGDSTVDAYDVIKGIISGGVTASDYSDKLDFAGSAAVTDFTASANVGTIMSHQLSNGYATFDDADAFGAAIKINANNLDDVVAYLQANTATNDVAAFAYDKDSDGTEESTMVFHNGTIDSLVLLDGNSTIDHLVTSGTTTSGELFIA